VQLQTLVPCLQLLSSDVITCTIAQSSYTHRALGSPSAQESTYLKNSCTAERATSMAAPSPRSPAAAPTPPPILISMGDFNSRDGGAASGASTPAAAYASPGGYHSGAAGSTAAGSTGPGSTGGWDSGAASPVGHSSVASPHQGALSGLNPALNASSRTQLSDAAGVASASGSAYADSASLVAASFLPFLPRSVFNACVPLVVHPARYACAMC